ncbi:MAG: hypothetical protein JRI23_16255 [Deltaproteobacteria bacterium]|jgi:eight-cysteine-cluster-containing protein|nr:hypothetical protein [Deltaproteobacteria bacterium]MBW2533324.1 hypothetical protein [Deltaproteobacteria bacterium]
MSTCVVHKVALAALAASASVVGCAVDVVEFESAPLDSISIDVAAIQAKGRCPNGWINSAFVKVFCPEGMTLVQRDYGLNSCVRCLEASSPQAPGQCEGSWRDARLMFGCVEGFELEYSADDQCKRCVQVEVETEDDGFECQTHDDCFRTGCSGEICAAESQLSPCIWRPEHACYEDKYCGCIKGRCGFKAHPELEQCIDDARDGG